MKICSLSVGGIEDGEIRVEGAVRATLKMKSRERRTMRRRKAGRDQRRHNRAGRRKGVRNMEKAGARAPLGLSFGE